MEKLRLALVSMERNASH